MPGIPPPPPPAGAGGFFSGALGHESFGGKDQAGDGGRVLQGGTGHFGRVHDALGDQVAELAGRGIVALAGPLDLFDDDRAFDTGVVRDLAGRLFESAADDVHADLLIAFELEFIQGGDDLDQGGAAAGDDAFFDRRAGGRKGVFDAVLLLFEFSLGGRADLNDGDAAGELRQTLFQFFFVIIRSPTSSICALIWAIRGFGSKRLFCRLPSMIVQFIFGRSRYVSRFPGIGRRSALLELAMPISSETSFARPSGRR